MDLIKLLKDCKIGTPLYSPIFGDCTFNGVTDLQYISVLDDLNSEWEFRYDGSFNENGECLLFPSSVVRCWDYFNVYYYAFPDYMDSERLKRIKQLFESKDGKFTEDLTINEDIIWYIDAVSQEVKSASKYCCPYGPHILRTGIKLEEFPEFDLGSVVKCNDNFYIVSDKEGVNDEEPYRLTSNTLSSDKDAQLATDEEIEKWNEDILHYKSLHYSKHKKKIVTWFYPGKIVIARNFDYDKIPKEKGTCLYWKITMFSHYNHDDKEFPYVCCDDAYPEILPFNSDTIDLIGTTKRYDKN